MRGEIDSNLATARADLQSNVTILKDTAITFTGIKTFEDDVILESNLRIQGDLLVANTVNMTVSDPILELGSNNQNTGDVGLVMTRHGTSNSNVAVFFDESTDILKLGYTLNGANDSTLELDSNSLAVTVQGAFTAASLSGDGSGLTTLNASNLSSGTVPSARLSLGASDIPNLDADKITTGTLTRPISTTTGTFSGDLTVGTANLFVDVSTSNVGIGTASPSDKLHVYGAPMIQHDTRRVISTAAWYKIGTWDAAASDGARLKVSLLGQSGYNNATRDRGGETIIYASINNDLSASVANIDGLVESHGKPVTTQVKFKQVGADRTNYEIHAYTESYTQHSMSVECSGTTTFTKEWVASSDPGVESATVSHAIF